MYLIFETKNYCKSLQKIRSSVGGKKIIDEVNDCLRLLQKGIPLPSNYKDHSLRGEYVELRECHIRADVLLVYKVEKDKMILILAEIGSHSYLF
jgi:mRNA interferase YafQ